MALTLKYQSKQFERSTDGESYVVVFTGTQAEVESAAAAATPGADEASGTLESVRIQQDGGAIWSIEYRYSRDADGGYTNKPNTVYGRKSCTLHGGMLSMPLSTAAKYLMNWDHYLAAAPGITEIPAWWETAKEDSDADQIKYIWIRSRSELPNSNGARWKTLKDPTKPGVERYDVATYCITEVAKFKSAYAAGNVIANQLNTIGTPTETFGITGGNWKCDDATIVYRDRAWYATLTWTLSGDPEGWDTDLYD